MPPRTQALAIPAGVAHNSIPLQCLLCPKKPSFSDVSHLLTHISSKSHLSNRFKTEIRSNKEKDARETLRQFQDWYERYGIQGLLADRMSAKDKKTVPKRNRAKGRLLKLEPSYDDDDDDEEFTIKAEPLSQRDTNESLHAHSSRQTSVYDYSPYEPSTSRPLRRLYPAPETPGQDSKTDSVAPSVASEVESADALAEDEIDALSIEDADRAKLKGIFWPGMSLFDSATPDQKRKRNQRKDVSVMRNMEQVAASVERTECIWTEVRNLQRTRDIYATPSPEPEDDEDVAIPPPKKKRARRSTAAPIQARVQPRPTRASARISNAKKTKPSEILESLDDYVLDTEVQRAAGRHLSSETNNGLDGESETSPVLKSEDTGFHVYHDSPELSHRGHGQSDATAEDDVNPLSVSPALTWGSTGTDNSAHALKYDQGTRQALQPLDSNLAMSSSTNTFKGTAVLRRGQSDLGQRSDAVNHGLYYGHPHQTFGSNVQPSLFGGGMGQQYSQHYYPSYNGGQAFITDGRPPMSNGFLAINAINSQPNHGLPSDYNPYQLSTGSGGFYNTPTPTNPTGQPSYPI